jgi:ABC-type microcin C transport system permease subunit YejE
MLGFLIAAAAGFLTPQIESAVTKPLVSALEKRIPVTPNETRAIAFMVALLGAAVLCALVDSGSVFGVIIGAILGYFGLRIFNAVKAEIEGRTGD